MGLIDRWASALGLVREPERCLEARIAGVALQLDEPLVWKHSMGTRAYQVVLDTSKHRADKIIAAAEAHQFSDGRTRVRGDAIGPLELEVREPGYPSHAIRGIYLSRTTSTGDPLNKHALVLTDIRALAERTIVERAYNVPRGSGSRKIVSDSAVPIEVAQTVGDRIYRRNSLHLNGKKWTGKEVLEDVLTEVFGDLWEWDTDEGGVGIEPAFSLDVEGLILHRMNGREAIDVALAHLPGTQIYPHPDGKIRIATVYGTGAISALKRAGHPRSGSWTVADHGFLRPRKVRVFFEQEAELRFDYSTTGAATQRVRGREPMELENVLPSPDPLLTLTDGTKVAAGTWITFDQAFAAWAADTEFAIPNLLPALKVTDALVRRMYMVGLGTLHNILNAGTPGGIYSVWSGRLNAIQQHWRKTFRISPPWTDKIRRLLPVRAAILDDENGVRANAQAWFNHSVRPSQSGLWQTRHQSEQGWHVTNCFIPFDPLNAFLTGVDNLVSSPAPAVVQVLDSDNGVIHLDIRKDVFGRATEVAPGTLTGTGFPTFKAGDVFVTWSSATLDEAWDCAVVLTAVQDTPNNEKRLLAVEVDAAEAGEALGFPVHAKQLGPDFEIHAGVETARYAWFDGRAEEIRAAFFDGDPWPQDLLVNQETVRAVAHGQAARVYAALQDRAEGRVEVRFNPEIVPVGSLQQVDHVIHPQQGLSTVLTCPPLLEAPNVMATLPASVRATLRRLVQQ